MKKQSLKMTEFENRRRHRLACKQLAQALALLDPYGYGHPFVSAKLAQSLGWKEKKDRGLFRSVTMMDRLVVFEMEK